MTVPGPRALTGGQAGLWFVQRIDPASPALNTGEVVALSGEVDDAALVTAIEDVVRGVDVYWLRFEATDDGGAEQTEAPDHSWRVTRLDLRAADEPRRAAEDWIASDMSVVADLTGGDRTRRAFGQAVMRVADDEVWWYSRAHHLLVDGYAMSLVVERVAGRYGEIVGGSPAPEDGLVGWRHVADLDDAYVASPGHEIDRAYWMSTVADRDPPRSLSELVALPAPTMIRRRRLVAPDGFDRFRERCAGAEVSWPDALLALVAVYVARLTGRSDVALGLPVMGRLDRPTLRAAATMMNVVPLWVEVDPAGTVAEVAMAVARSRRAMRRHQRYRSEQLRRDLRLLGGDRRLHGPQVNIMPFELRHRFGSVAGRLRNVANGPVEDLTINVARRDQAGGLDIDVDANPRCYAPWEVEAHRDRLGWLIEDAPLDVAVEDLELVPPDEQTLVLDRWNATQHPVPDVSLAELVETQAVATPDAVALIGPDGPTMSYGALMAASGALAERLVERGVRPGELVGVSVERSIELVVALIAIARCGAGFVPFDTEYPAARRAHMRRVATPRCMIVDQPSGGSPGLDEPIDEIVLEDWWAASATSRWSRPWSIPPGSPAYVIFTSGSTGAPKGVEIGQRAIVNRLLWMQDRYRLVSTDRVLQKTPAGFDVSVWEFFWPLIAGATMVVAAPGGQRDPAYLARAIVDHRVSTVHFVPSMLEAFLDDPASGATRGVLRRIICSGEVLPAELAGRAIERTGARLDNLYGPTEAAIDVTAWRVDPDRDRASVPIGRPVWNTALRILDRRGRLTPVGVPGELHLAGRQLARGYVGRADLTAERFIDDPFDASGGRLYRTGDLVRWRPDGAVEYLGRLDRQVKLRGQRIELGEIESVVAADAAVTAAVADVRAIGSGDQRLVAWVVPSTPGALDLDAVVRRAAGHLPAFMVPQHWVVIDELPVDVNGKLARSSLPDPVLDIATSPESVPRTPVEESVVCRFAEVLGLPAVGMDDDFFERGGHSLSATILVDRLRPILGDDLSVAEVFATPTPRRLLSRDRDVDSGFGPALAIRRRPGAPTVWCVHPAGGLAWCYAALGAALAPDVAVMGLQAPGWDGGELPATIDEMARRANQTLIAQRHGGDIHLLGWSVGGVIAHEMAVQLEESGVAVASVVLVDAYPSTSWRGRPEPTETDAWRALLYIGGIDPADAAGADGELTREAALDALGRERRALSTLSPERLDRMAEIVVNHGRAMHRHRERRYPGAVTHVAAAESTAAGFEPATWQGVVGGLTTRQSPGAHARQLSDEPLAALVDLLTSLTRAIRRHPDAPYREPG
ncbi:MAG: amino acid adenylation domain-containing protein [Desertimonas sp.]